MKTIKFEKLKNNQKELLEEAAKVMETAYNPYSKFYVGAAIRTIDNQIISASNVENAAYGSTICAERNALGKANSLGKRMYKSIAIIARGETFNTKEVTGPCGSCRQMIYESSQISGRNIELILSTTKKDRIVLTSIKELLPMAFGPKELGIKIARYQKQV